MDWEVHCFDFSLGVEIHHLVPLDASVGMINLRLNIEDGSDICLFHLLDVLLKLRIRSNRYVGITDLVK